MRIDISGDNMRPAPGNQSGFTLLELIIVIAAILILLAITLIFTIQ